MVSFKNLLNFKWIGGLFVVTALFFSMTPSGTAASTTVQDKSVTTNEDVSKNVALSATGSRGETFTYSIAQLPSHGSVTLSGSSVTYTPAANWNGTDSFLYQAYGSINGASGTARVTVTVTAVNDIPTANAGITVTMSENTTKSFTLGGSDVDGNALTCYGQSTGLGTFTVNTNCSASFTPNTNLTGTYNLSFRVYDGVSYSPYQTVAITINKENDAPVVTDLTKNLNEDSSANMVLSGSDDDGDDLIYSIVTGPEHGIISLSDSVLTYTPAANWNGTDTLTYLASDGTANSNIGTVTFTVNALNDMPVPVTQTVEVEKGLRTFVQLTATDVDDTELTFNVASANALGSVQSLDTSAGTFYYLPAEGFTGQDVLSYSVRDGTTYVTQSLTFNVSATHAAPTNGPGQQNWRYDLGESVVSAAPAFMNGNIYFGTFQNGFSVFGLKSDGTFLNEVNIGMHVESAILALKDDTGDRLVVNTIAGSDSPDEGKINGLSVVERRGTIQIPIDQEGAIASSFWCVNTARDNGRDNAPAIDESRSTLFTADVHYPDTAGSSYLTASSLSDCVTTAEYELPQPGWTFGSVLFYPNFQTTSKKDGLVVVTPQITTDDFGGRAMAFQMDSEGNMASQPLWTFDANSEFTRGSTTITDLGLIYVTTNDTMYALSASDGQLVWENNFGGFGYGAVTVGADNHTLYVANGDSLIALNGSTGAELWRVSVSSKGTPVVGDSGIYVLGDTRLLAVDTDGKELWSTPFSEESTYQTLGMDPTNGNLVFAAGNAIYSYNTESDGLSQTSDFPSAGADEYNTRLPQVHLTEDTVEESEGPVDPVAPDTFWNTSRYGTTDTVSYCDQGMLMDLSWPTYSSATGPFSTVVLIHGGGWTSGTRTDLGNLRKELVDEGFLVASVDYRLAPENKLPAAMEDINCAVRYLRANAVNYNLDPNNIGATGGSAGGHLASLLGTSDLWEDVGPYQDYSSDVQAVVNFYGATDLRTFFTGFSKNMARNIVGTTDLTNQIFQDLSPVVQVTADDAHFLTIHGVLDAVVPITQSEAFTTSLNTAGGEATLLRVENANHGLGGSNISPSLSSVLQSMADFFAAELQ